MDYLDDLIKSRRANDGLGDGVVRTRQILKWNCTYTYGGN